MMRILILMAVSMVMACCAQTRPAASGTPVTPVAPGAKTVFVRVETSEGRVTLELDNEHAPISVANFLMYADTGAYDGTTFHRVVKDFVIQGGGFEPDLLERAKAAKEAGRPDKPIKNEWQNGLKNLRGTIAMARDAQPDTATREFYINVVDNAKLDTAREKTGNAGYAVFGRVVDGMDVVDRIRMVATKVVAKGTKNLSEEMRDVPVEPVVIKSVRSLERHY